MIISVFVNHQTSEGKVFPDKKSISKTKTLIFNINFSEILPIAWRFDSHLTAILSLQRNYDEAFDHMEENCIDVLVHFTFKHSINSAANQTNYATSLLFAVSNIFEIICNTFLYLFTTLRDHLFSTYAKFSEKLTFFTPWNTHERF